MKKIIAMIVVLLLLLCTGIAYAVEPITLDITAVDVQTGKAITKTTYVENELFELRVEIGIPRFTTETDLKLIIETDGVNIDEHDLTLADGVYYITGVVIDQPAAVRVKIKDMAYDNAVTAEQMYNAMQKDRTISKTFRFYGATTSGAEVIIPKTGDASVIASALMCITAAAVLARRRR